MVGEEPKGCCQLAKTASSLGSDVNITELDSDVIVQPDEYAESS